MSLAEERTPHAAFVGRTPNAPGRVSARTLQAVLIAALSGGLFWLVWLYGNGLRDPRYLDGWLLAGGMGLQLYFHVAIKGGMLSAKSAIRWRKVHIFLGYLLIAVFVSHSDFSMPDTGFEWALWTSFVLVALSGLFGVYLAWALKSKRVIEDGLTHDRIPIRRAELARQVQAIVDTTDPTFPELGLPMPPYEAWINELYTNHLRDFFRGPRHLAGHLIGTQRPLRRMTDEIDGLSRYVDRRDQEKLAVIRELVITKDGLDFAHVHLGLGKAWLFVHVGATYAMIVLSVLHILIAYAFSSGVW